MADNVHVLRPKARPAEPTTPAPAPDAYADLQRRRTEMIGAWTAWLAQEPDPGDVLQEIHGTTTAMRSLADLMALATGRRG